MSHPSEQQIGLSLSLQGIGAVRDRLRILRDISLEIGSNEFIGILGPSGSGKSTLIEILTLTGRPTEGRVLFDERHDIRTESSRYSNSFGYVPQQDLLYSTLTVEENLRYAARLRMPREKDETIRGAVDLMLKRVGLENHRTKQACKLSGGQRKRVGIAMELFKNPRLLILDEPTSGLDPAMERKLMEQLRRIADAGTTVVCSTHVMENISLFDKVAVIGKKKLGSQELESGDLDLFESPDKLLDHYGAVNYAELYSLLEADPNTIYLDDGERRNGTADERRWIPNAPEIPPKPTFRQFSDVFLRQGTLFLRDRFLFVSSFVLPLVLGFLVVLSQQKESNLRPLVLFSIVLAVWFGMNNSVRSIVSRRKHFSRESLSGLSMHSFLFGISAFHLAVGFVQILLLWLTVGLLGLELCDGLHDDLLRVRSVLFPILFGSYFSGLGLGLLVSTLSRTENGAIAWLPLLIMPQLLLSTVAAGNSIDSLADPNRIQPIGYSRLPNDESPRPPAENSAWLELFKRFSFLCFSRPTFFFMELCIAREPDRTKFLDEIFHYLGLTSTVWLALWTTFWFRQKTWRTTRE